MVARTISGLLGRRRSEPASPRLAAAAPAPRSPVRLVTHPHGAGGRVEGAAPDRHLVFVLDATGSMQPWIDATKRVIRRMLRASSEAGRPPYVATLVFYRDHDQHRREEFLTRTFGPTSDVAALEAELDSVRASGGGDGPEAVAEALQAAAGAITAADVPNAATVVTLLTDAPPHGVCPGEHDNFPAGGPEGAVVDLFAQADRLCDLGARLVTVVAGRHGQAYDSQAGMGECYVALAKRASPHDDPIVVPLDAGPEVESMLVSLVTGAAAVLEEDDRLFDAGEAVEEEVRAEFRSRGADADEDAVNAEVSTRLQARGVTAEEVRHDGSIAVDDKVVAKYVAAGSLQAVQEEVKVMLPEPSRERYRCARVSRGGSGGAEEAATETLAAKRVSSSAIHQVRTPVSAAKWAAVKGKRASKSERVSSRAPGAGLAEC